MNNKTILMIEDDIAISTLNEMMISRVSNGLIRSVKARTLAEGKALLSENIDLVLLDLMLPDGSGLDLVEEIRSETFAPILMLTAMSDDTDKLIGLRAGGNDYITKPYNVIELCIKVMNLLMTLERRDKKNLSTTIIKGSLTIDVLTVRAWNDGKDMCLSPKEFSLLLFFAQHEGEVLSARRIYENNWQQPMTDNNHALKMAISRLRQKLISSGYIISTKRKGGYTFEKEK